MAFLVQKVRADIILDTSFWSGHVQDILKAASMIRGIKAIDLVQPDCLCDRKTPDAKERTKGIICENEEDKCCKCGKVGEDLTYAPDPFAKEINGDDTPVWECEECRYQSAMDI